tara:strand:- start:103 stop:333 length:231 start_codon:yes stop_codon:yes gene_type:complete
MTSTTTRSTDRYTTTESGGRQNIFSIEPKLRAEEGYEGYGPNAEKLNGRLAMIGLVAGFVSYVATGNFFFFGLAGF